MHCSCCGNDHDPTTLAALQCHEDVKVCRVCVGWLRGQLHVPDSTPILPVRDMNEAVTFYESAGFDVRLYEGGGFAFVHLDDESVFDLGLEELMTPEANFAGCGLIVANVENWHAKLRLVGVQATDPRDQPWGMREFTLTDPSGNRVRMMQNI